MVMDDKTSAWWRFVHLDPLLFRAAVVAVVAVLGAVGIFLDPSIPDTVVTAWVALAAVVQVVWARPSVTANAKVVSLLPDPAVPHVIAAGEAVTTASNAAILDAAQTTPR